MIFHSNRIEPRERENYALGTAEKWGSLEWNYLNRFNWAILFLHLNKKSIRLNKQMVEINDGLYYGLCLISIYIYGKSSFSGSFLGENCAPYVWNSQT